MRIVSDLSSASRNADSSGRFRVEGSTRVFKTSTDVQIGTLINQGGGRYCATIGNVAVNPGNIFVKSSLGGFASRNVSLK
ncbi:hypothetical protein [Cryobacterium lyxosi]|uniref:Uncharacterized protein n=1 Tax=Cryobacterium lyxosi TaxID=1259228 RepID=A0A4V3IPC8_9MICO|nr:hypothetical protein [Cryobacterium lyxosi]TFD27643.1 hypothetical protein E3T27_03990 [Cryobacterium lyxosi]